MYTVTFCEYFARQRRPKVSIAFADYDECMQSKASGELLLLVFPRSRRTMVSNINRAAFALTRKKSSALTLGYTQATRSHLCGQSPIDNILNDFESVNLVQSENTHLSNNRVLSLLRISVLPDPEL